MSYGVVRVDVCCNDPDNGLFDHCASGIQIYDLVELMANDLRGPVFREHVGAIQISRRKFPVIRSKEWFGNWCWNAYWMTAEDAAEMLAYAHGLRVFNCDMAEDRIFNRWRVSRPFDEHDKEFLARQAAKAKLAA